MLLLGALFAAPTAFAAEETLCEIQIGEEAVKGECTDDWWDYRLYDPNTWSVSYFTTQCYVWQEGTWESYGNWSYACVGANPDPFPDQSTIDTKAIAYAGALAHCELNGSIAYGNWLQPGETLRGDAYTLYRSQYRNGVETFNVREAIVSGTCPDGRTAGRRLIQMRSRDTYVITEDYFAASGESCPSNPDSPVPGDNQGGNPVLHSTGEKIETETDYSAAAGGLSFKRTYRSFGNPDRYQGFGRVGWRHNYSERLGVYNLTNDFRYDSNPSVRSPAYDTPEQACQQGWEDLRQSAFRGLVSDAQAVYDDGNCALEINQEPVAELRVHTTPKAPLIFKSETYKYHTTARGERHSYRLEGDHWVNTFDPDKTLHELDDGTWLLNDGRGNQRLFDQEGLLLEITTRDGRTTTLDYNDVGQLATVTGPFGRQLQFSYTNGWITQVITPDGPVDYAYNSHFLKTITYPDGKTRTYDSVNPGLLRRIIDENGVTYAEWTYDGARRVISSEHAGGAERTTFTYNADGTTTVTEPLGAQRTYGYEVNANRIQTRQVDGERCSDCSGIRDRQYDSAGNLIQTEDYDGLITTYAYNARGLVTQQTQAAGTPEARTTTTQWHPDFPLAIRIETPEQITQNSYDAGGHLTQRNTIDQTTGETRTSTYTYNALGLLTQTDGPRTDVADITTYQYDAQGNRTQITNALGHTTRITAHDPSGRPTEIVDPNGLVTRLVYDPRGRLIEQWQGDRQTRHVYDPAGQLIETHSPDGGVLYYEYDAAHRLIALEDGHGNRLEYELDAAGNRTAEHAYDPDGQLERTQSRVYDELGRLSRSLGAEDQTTEYRYDPAGRLIEILDPRDAPTRSAYDALGRLQQSTDAQNGVTRYAYDPAGNLIQKTDAAGRTEQHQYDALNRLIRSDYTAPSGEAAVIEYAYDTGENAIGRLVRVTDPSGATAWQYNAHGEVIQKTQTILNAAEAGQTQLITRHSYDAQGNLSETIYPSGLAVQYAYNQGRLSAVDLNGAPWITTIQYQPFGPVSGWTWADGSAYQNTYDLDGRLAQHPIGPEQRQLQYDPAGNLIQQNDLLPDGQSRTRRYQYDLLGRLIDAQADLLQQSWQYDANGNRLSQYDGALVTNYAIDPQSNRLLQIVDDTLEDRYYDATGNLVEDAEHRYAYGPRNRLVAIDDGNQARYRHNALGQRVYKYGRLSGTDLIGDVNQDGFVDQHDIHLVNGLAGIEFDCDGPGQGDENKNSDNNGKSGQNTPQGQTVACVATNIGDSKNNGKGNGQNNQGEIEITQTLLFAYDEQGRLLGEYEEDGTPVQETLWLGDLPVATIREGVAYRVYPDHLGTPRAVADQDDTILWRWKSDPFGTTEADEDPDQDGQRFVYNLRFPGQYFDGETGRHYNYFRDYDPSTGRYIESDPIGMIGGLNLYAYVTGNPISQSDFHGLKGGGVKQIPNPYNTGPNSPMGNNIADIWPTQIYPMTPYSPGADYGTPGIPADCRFWFVWVEEWECVVDSGYKCGDEPILYIEYVLVNTNMPGQRRPVGDCRQISSGPLTDYYDFQCTKFYRSSQKPIMMGW